MKNEVLRKKKLMDAQKNHSGALTYIERYHSQSSWQSGEDVARQFAKLTSNTAILNALKEHIRIREVGFGWNDVYIAWSNNGSYFTREELRDQFIYDVPSVEGERGIPPEPKVNFPYRGEQT